MARRRSNTGEPHPVSAAIQALRKELGLTQQALAVAMGVHTATVCRWEAAHQPPGFVLQNFEELARTMDRSDLARVFQDALYAEVRSAVRAVLEREARSGRSAAYLPDAFRKIWPSLEKTRPASEAWERSRFL